MNRLDIKFKVYDIQYSTMGSCFSSNTSDGGGSRPKLETRHSSLASLDDSMHVMMKRSSLKGALEQQDGSFYRPRGEVRILASLSKIGDETKFVANTNTEASTENSEEVPDEST